ncbi:hypothetical protein BDA96_01G138300 [Sorghum bicolor]|uniref:Uncharacterized protein n=2 Tax=Sorghum bicolor TaxID=4558 RepID=A0A921RX61_SORBI|nr:hypothetical protein BDA96_01G138300 [Sorghum bicolor]KXG37820.1 hypothetical protein SORBI_3001G132500 [Sorghum bicolor]
MQTGRGPEDQRKRQALSQWGSGSSCNSGCRELFFEVSNPHFIDATVAVPRSCWAGRSHGRTAANCELKSSAFTH